MAELDKMARNSLKALYDHEAEPLEEQLVLEERHKDCCQHSFDSNLT